MEEQEKKIRMKSWAEADRPRERLMQHGRRHLSDVELIAILIGSGNRSETAVELSRRILAYYQNDVAALGNASVQALSRFKGVGQAKALNIIAALELGRRHSELPAPEAKRLSSSRDAYLYLRPHFADLPHEEFWIILLNRANTVISKHLVSRGGQAGTVADPKIIFRIALENNAAYIVLAHNHPSGQLKPSNADVELTRKMVEAGKLLELRVYDHLIVTNHGYYSFNDEGKIN